MLHLFKLIDAIWITLAIIWFKELSENAFTVNPAGVSSSGNDLKTSGAVCLSIMCLWLILDLIILYANTLSFDFSVFLYKLKSYI